VVQRGKNAPIVALTAKSLVLNLPCNHANAALAAIAKTSG